MASAKVVKAVYYDEALPVFVEIIIKHLGKLALKNNCFLRDADGNLTFIERKKIPKVKRAKLMAEVSKKISTYISGPPVATPEELLDAQLADDTFDRFEFVNAKGFTDFIRLVERRIVGQDWMRGIQPTIVGIPPIVVFASHKGGVGRSTALAISAVEFARRGKTILAIDADLEAPGLGEMFGRRIKQPIFGALDYFVENGRGGVDRLFLSRMVSQYFKKSAGSVFVVPAVGERCREYPQNVIGKISRAYLEDVTAENSKPFTLLDQMRTMIKDLCSQRKYDAVFIDARAGLNETTAVAVQGLGAEILLFGVDTPQTWDGYRYFLAHLARFKEDEGTDWRYRLKMVHAKALDDFKSLAKFRDNAFELFAEHLYDEADEVSKRKSTAFNFDVDDHAAPHFAWPINMSGDFYEFNPGTNPQQLTPELYYECFGLFLESLAERLRFK